MIKESKDLELDSPEENLAPLEETPSEDESLDEISDEEIMDEPSEDLPDDEKVLDELSEDEDEDENEESDEQPEEEEEEEEEEPGIFSELYDKVFNSSWEMWFGSILLAVLSIFLFLLASPWGSSGGLLNIGQNIFDEMGVSLSESAPNGITDIMDFRYAMLSIVMLMGAMGSAMMAKEFAIRISPGGELFKGLFGGILMGIGCIIGFGCTIGNFFSGWPALSAGALIFVGGLVIGVFLAVKYLVWEMEKHPKMSSGKSWTFLQAKTKGRSLQPIAGIIVLIIGVIIAFGYNTNTEQTLFGFVLIGLLIGFILQRSRWCVVRALREPFLTGDSEPALAIMAGLLVGVLGFVIIKLLGLGPEISMVATNFFVPAIIGGIIFGFGMTIAGGCTVGSTWRAGEGHVKLWLALLGIVIMAPLTAEFIRPALMDALPEIAKQPVFMPDNYGYIGSVVILILIIILWYWFVKWNERSGKLSAF